jgi:hypothetical protein
MESGSKGVAAECPTRGALPSIPDLHQSLAEILHRFHAAMHMPTQVSQPRLQFLFTSYANTRLLHVKCQSPAGH